MSYVVWKRSDGFVNVSKNRLPNGWTCRNGKVFSFIELKTFDN